MTKTIIAQDRNTTGYKDRPYLNLIVRGLFECAHHPRSLNFASNLPKKCPICSQSFGSKTIFSVTLELSLAQSNTKFSTKIRRVEQEIMMLKAELLAKNEEILALKAKQIEIGNCTLCDSACEGGF